MSFYPVLTEPPTVLTPKICELCGSNILKFSSSKDDINNSEQGPHGLGLGGSLPLTSLNAMQLALCNHYALHSKL